MLYSNAEGRGNHFIGRPVKAVVLETQISDFLFVRSIKCHISGYDYSRSTKHKIAT